MKTVKLMTLALLLLSGCGQSTTIKARAEALGGLSGVSSAATQSVTLPPEMDALVCPSDMQLVPATEGHAAFCLDITPKAAAGHAAAATACLNVGKTLCTGAQYFQAKNSLLAATNYWSADISTTGAGSVTSYRFNADGVNGGFIAGGSYISLCCSR